MESMLGLEPQSFSVPKTLDSLTLVNMDFVTLFFSHSWQGLFPCLERNYFFANFFHLSTNIFVEHLLCANCASHNKH